MGQPRTDKGKQRRLDKLCRDFKEVANVWEDFKKDAANGFAGFKPAYMGDGLSSRLNSAIKQGLQQQGKKEKSAADMASAITRYAYRVATGSKSQAHRDRNGIPQNPWEMMEKYGILFPSKTKREELRLTKRKQNSAAGKLKGRSVFRAVRKKLAEEKLRVSVMDMMQLRWTTKQLLAQDPKTSRTQIVNDFIAAVKKANTGAAISAPQAQAQITPSPTSPPAQTL